MDCTKCGQSIGDDGVWQNAVKPKSALGLGHAVAQCLRTNAVDAIRFDGRNEIELERR